MTILLVLLVFVICSSLLASADDLLISLPDGQIQGHTYITENNKTYYAFQGIPYATPPIGDLRFEAPRPPQPWEGVWDATVDRKSCITCISILRFLESEDCLYISVFTPSLQPAEKLPVMVWIYGGKFVVGSSRLSAYPPDYLIEEDVIIVQFNYRLGPLGFLSTGDSAITGNFGLKDQTLAIQWVHDNIQNFGGDPEQVTIFGQSAGGVSVGLHLLNNKEAGLYRAAIAGSGSALTNWTIDQNPKAYAKLLATQLGGEFYLNDTQQLKKFLQEKTAGEIADAAIQLGSKSYNGKLRSVMDLLPLNQPWPVMEVENEDSFLTESPYVLLDSGRFNQVPIIIGICANEAAMFFSDLETAQRAALAYDTDPTGIIPADLRQNASDTEAVYKKIQTAYLNEGDTFSTNLVALTNYQSDAMFTNGVIKHAAVASQYVPVYLYQFAYYGRPLFTNAIPGAEKAGHGAELAFLFKQITTNTNDTTDVLVQNRMTKLWSNFAKFLDPTPEQSDLVNVTWPTTNSTFLTFLNINNTLQVKSHIRTASYQVWNIIYEKYGKKPYITF